MTRLNMRQKINIERKIAARNEKTAHDKKRAELMAYFNDYSNHELEHIIACYEAHLDTVNGNLIAA